MLRNTSSTAMKLNFTRPVLRILLAALPGPVMFLLGGPSIAIVVLGAVVAVVRL